MIPVITLPCSRSVVIDFETGYSGTVLIDVFEVMPVDYDKLLNRRNRFYLMVNDMLYKPGKEFHKIGRGWEGFSKTKAEALAELGQIKEMVRKHDALRQKEAVALLEGKPIAELYRNQRQGVEEWFKCRWGVAL